MSSNFDQYAQEANGFIYQLAQVLGYGEEKSKTFLVLRSVMHTLRDRITIAESFHLMAQLPAFLKTVYVDNWEYREKPLRIETRQEFLNIVNEYQAKYSSQLNREAYVIDESTVKAVLTALGALISKGELEDILAQLPDELKYLMAA